MPGLVGCGELFERFAVQFGVAADAARGLDRAGLRDPRGDFGRAFGGRRQSEVGRAYRVDFDMQVDPVEQRGRRPLLW